MKRINVYREIFMPYIVNTTKRIQNRTMMINLNDNNIVAYFFQLFATINYNYDVFLEYADTVERDNEKIQIRSKINNLGKKKNIIRLRVIYVESQSISK